MALEKNSRRGVKEMNAAYEQCFNALYETYFHPIYSFLFAKTQKKETALDLVQETFLRVWRRIEEIKEMPPAKQKNWIFLTAKNLFIDFYRKESTRKAYEQKKGGETKEEDPYAKIVLKEKATQVQKAIHALPEEQREILTMRVLGGMNSAEIGKCINKKPGTVRYLLSCARQTLAGELKLLEKGEGIHEQRNG